MRRACGSNHFIMEGREHLRMLQRQQRQRIIFPHTSVSAPGLALVAVGVRSA